MSSREQKQKETNGNEQNKRIQRITERVKHEFNIKEETEQQKTRKNGKECLGEKRNKNSENNQGRQEGQGDRKTGRVKEPKIVKMSKPNEYRRDRKGKPIKRLMSPRGKEEQARILSSHRYE